MDGVYILSRSNSFQPVRSVNFNHNGYLTAAPQLTPPPADVGDATSRAAIELKHIGSPCIPTGAKFVFFGTGADNNTFSCRLLGWTPVLNSRSNSPLDNTLWVPVNLCEVSVTLGATTGTGTFISSSNFFADTIALVATSGNPNVSMEIISPADDTIAHITVSFKGAQWIEPLFTTGGVATDCNALVQLF